jgi:hypothetical protein
VQRFSSLFVIFLIIILNYAFSFGQIQPQDTGAITTPPPLVPLISVLNVGTFVETLWSLGVGLDQPEYKPKSNEEVLKDFNQWLLSKPKVERWKGEIAEYNFALKYKENIKKIIDHLSFIGSERGMFLYNKMEIPVRFAQAETGMVFLVTGVGSSTVFNTLRTTPKSRAAKIISTKILPEMETFYDFFKDTDIKYCGMAVVYGSEDFSDESISRVSLKAEVVTLVVSSENCKKFVDGIMTEDQLIDLSDIYLKDRDMGFNVKKIKVTLE